MTLCMWHSKIERLGNNVSLRYLSFPLLLLLNACNQLTQILGIFSKLKHRSLGQQPKMRYRINDYRLFTSKHVRSIYVCLHSRVRFQNHVSNIIRKAFSLLFAKLRNCRCNVEPKLISFIHLSVLFIANNTSKRDSLAKCSNDCFRVCLQRNGLRFRIRNQLTSEQAFNPPFPQWAGLEPSQLDDDLLVLLVELHFLVPRSRRDVVQ